MFARITTLQIQPGQLDEGIRISRESIVPATKQQHGFVSATMLADRAANKALSITIWETEADIAAGEASGYYQEQLAKIAPLVAAPPTREVYEVTVQVP